MAGRKRGQLKLLDTAALIATDPETPEEDKGFLTKYLVQVTLPHSNPGNVPAFRRTNGNITLTLQPHLDPNFKPLYPYGSVPRLLLYWLTREVLRQKSPRLVLSDTINGFLLDLGLSPDTGGGKRGDSHRLKDQMERLFRARISLDVDLRGGEAVGHGWQDMQVAPKGVYWWDFRSPANQATLFDCWIELSPEFYEAITNDPVPVDMRALRALKRSPMALDLYAWATHQTYSVTRKGSARFVPWRALMQQLGSDYGDIKDFRKKTKAALRKIQAIYPALRIEDEEGGFRILPSRPAVLPKRG
jgi:hypothetical protein